MAKRIFDFTFSLVALFIFSPLLLIIFLLIKINDGGGVFYRGTRVGKDCSLFKIFKFRTMVKDADKIGGPSTSDDDPRVTKVGKFLRKFKLDEIPQLLNVLKGDMSFVGPRPEVPQEVDTYSQEEKKIFSVRPGITDWASLKFHNEGEILKGAEDPHQAYRQIIKPGKIKLGLKYVNESSISTDIKIIIKTIATLVKSRV